MLLSVVSMSDTGSLCLPYSLSCVPYPSPLSPTRFSRWDRITYRISYSLPMLPLLRRPLTCCMCPFPSLDASTPWYLPLPPSPLLRLIHLVEYFPPWDQPSVWTKHSADGVFTSVTPWSWRLERAVSSLHLSGLTMGWYIEEWPSYLPLSPCWMFLLIVHVLVLIGIHRVAHSSTEETEE